MKNIDIIKLGNGGFLKASAHSIPVEHFYKFVKFKRAVQQAYERISKCQVAFLAETGLTPEVLRDGTADAEKLERYGSLNASLIDEETEIAVARIPVVCYKGLYDENGELFADPAIEAIVLDNLFTEEE
jgi:hypothetical protein